MIKNVSGKPQFQTIFQVFKIPAYFWLIPNHFRNIRSDKSCKEVINQEDKENFK